MNTTIHPSLNRFLAGLDAIATGIRLIIGTASAEETGKAVTGLRQETISAFESVASYEGHLSLVTTILADGGPKTDAERVAFAKSLEVVRARLNRPA